MTKVLVTGGAGFIGSHTTVALVLAGFQPIIFDNLENSSKQVVRNISQITGTDIDFIKGDVRSYDDLSTVFNEHKIDAVIHFAGAKAVSESVTHPLKYYSANVLGAINLIQLMDQNSIFKLIFSSSATVYNDLNKPPFSEISPTGNPTNPYGKTKLYIENILNDMCFSDPRWSVSALRYFNPAGAHASGLIGENPAGIPANLMPLIVQTALGIREELKVFGSDYKTNDGTAVRDYIHVSDLARGHLAALKHVITNTGFHIFNLGTGSGTSVLELIKTFENINSVKIPWSYADRRPGDVAESFADTGKAKSILNWTAKKDIRAMCKDSWRFYRMLASHG
ncbi:UDP-glucose 4-epimerase GalE [Alphaproteobacteria bacterium]|nr:UDP-glucose 4-epimerase GalE [Alphaproteobacteria bacterium]